jgi:Autotransporter beta-domain/Bacterial Ig-like domain (group 3)/Putative Ig domain
MLESIVFWAKRSSAGLSGVSNACLRAALAFVVIIGCTVAAHATCAPSDTVLSAQIEDLFAKRVGVAYSADLQVTACIPSGAAPAGLTFALTGGALPSGTTLSTSGRFGFITGTPTTAGPYTYQITATDSTGLSATGTFSNTIAPAIIITPTASAVTQVGQTYSQTNVASNGTTPFTYSLASGTLPAGTTLNPATGTVSGMPTTAGPFSYTIGVADSTAPTHQTTTTSTISGTIAPPPLTITPTASAATQVGQSYFQTNVAGGGTTPYTYSLASGALPAGTALNTSSGTVSGTPATAGPFSYAIKVTDGGAQTATTATVSGTIAPPTLTITATASATTQIGQSYSQANVAGGGTTPYTYSVASGTLPAGTTLNTSTGTVSGTPITVGPYSYAIKVTDGGSPTPQTVTTVTISGTIAPPTLTITATASATKQAGQSYSQTNAASGGTVPYTYSLAAGALPAGTSLNSSTGTVSGTPTTAGSFSYAIKVTDSGTPTAQTATTATISGTIAVAPTSTSLSSSRNPSAQGQPVTFTATVSGGSSPSGTVTFYDGGASIGTAALSGVAATFTTSALALGTHAITAKYGGNASNTASTSPVLQQSVAVPTDSIRLRQMQILGTQQSAQLSGQNITGAVDNAINDGFSGNVQAVVPNGSGFTYNFAADEASDPPRSGQAGSASTTDDGVKRFMSAPDARTSQLVNDEFSALGYAGVTKAPPKPFVQPREWLAWIDVRGISFNNNTPGADLSGNQVNVTAGLTRKLTPDFLVGGLAGYEKLDFNSDALNSRLKGDGWTVGGYLGWRLTPNVRFDMMLARSAIGYDDTSGMAAASFSGERWLASGGFTGTYLFRGFVLQPSAKLYALWEHDGAYTDSLGTAQPTNDFSTGRASAGTRASFPLEWSTASVALAPYAGIYGDYYFTGNSATIAGVPTPALLLQGWSARATAGLDMKFRNGGVISLGGEFGGIGSNTSLWTYKASGSVPF